MTNLTGSHFIYSPLHGWANEQAMKDPNMKNEWDFIEKYISGLCLHVV